VFQQHTGQRGEQPQPFAGVRGASRGREADAGADPAAAPARRVSRGVVDLYA